jgi:acetyltransferase AlgX (SGNH hydrolase-like protein)
MAWVARRTLLLFAIAGVQFAAFESALRAWGHSEAAPSFQALFVPEAQVGYRLRPNARTRFVTSEFDVHIAVNAQGVRDDRDIGPKPSNERRIVVLGDSLVLSVQVERQQTFCSLLEARLNRGEGPYKYRVINAGVQGYGPVEELLFFRRIASEFQPDLVIETIFVGNDAEEALASAPKLHSGARAAADVLSDSVRTRMRRVVRRSMVLQVLRLRAMSMLDRFPTWKARPEPPLQSYAAHPSPRIAEGLRISRDCVTAITDEAAKAGARTMVMFVPARFQVNDVDYAHLKAAVAQAGGELVRDAASERFATAMADLPVPRLDVLPALRSARHPDEMFFQQTVHLTPRGHEVVAEAMERFIREKGLASGL